MNIAKQLAKNLRALYFGKNWTAVDFRRALEDVTWEEASKSIQGSNSILTLVHHTMYYMKVQLPVFDGDELVASDKESFIHDALTSDIEWASLQKEMFDLVEKYARKIEGLSEDTFDLPFGEEKYGSYFRNIQGVIEHSHYHLGQIVILAKLVKSD